MCKMCFLIYFLFSYLFIWQGQCTLIDITVNAPELANRLFFICSPWTDVDSHPKKKFTSNETSTRLQLAELMLWFDTASKLISMSLIRVHACKINWKENTYTQHQSKYGLTKVGQRQWCKITKNIYLSTVIFVATLYFDPTTVQRYMVYFYSTTFI